VGYPTDGYGIYEAVNPALGSSVYTPRLQQIAAGGFKLVMNYSLPLGHIADVTGYIAAANTAGLKVIVALHDPAIWRDATYSTAYPLLYADSGNAATGTAFMQYIVGQVKNLAGVWGYYVADEPVVGDHTTWATYSAAVRTADNTHPRLVIESATPGASNFYQGSTLYFDQCEVGGDDYYPIGNTQVAWDTAQNVASGIQTFCASKSIQSAFVHQAFSWQQAFPPARCSPYPSCAPFPDSDSLFAEKRIVEANMSPRVVLYWAFHKILTSDNPTLDWNTVVAAINQKVVTMTANPTLVQSNTAASSAASPTSINPALSGNATPGNFLVVFVCVTGTSPTITSPTGWIAVRNSVSGSVAFGMFVLPGCTAITGPGAITVGGTGGGAAASILEFSGMGPSATLDLLTMFNNTSTSPSSTSAATAKPLYTNELLLAGLMFAATTITNTTGTTGEYSTAVASVVSTNGTPNAQIAVYWGVSLSNVTLPNFQATLGASVSWLVAYVRYASLNSQIIQDTNIGGVAGQLVGQFYQGMVGG
jgi:hypothetical protein